MATTLPVSTPPDSGPAAAEAFVADRQAFWGSFTKFVTMGAAAIVLLLIVMAVFLT